MNREEMKLPVTINFRSVQSDDSHSDVSEFSADGTLYRKSNGDYLSFDEVIKEVGTVNTIIKISNNSEVSILRKGTISMNQRFIENQVTTGVYRTPYGIVDIGIKTTNISYSFDRKREKGSFELKYGILNQNESEGSYLIHIDFEGRNA